MENNRIFLAGVNEAFLAKLQNLLERASFQVLGTASSSTETIRRCRETPPEVLVLTQRLRGGNGMETAELLQDVTQSVVLLDQESLTSQKSGDIVYLQMPVHPDIFINTVTVLSKVGSRFHTLCSRISTLEENMKEQKKINRAKGKIMQAFAITEDEAHAFLRKIAMNRRLRLAEAAESILQEIDND